jgi:ABC-2 type transport system ATP-binding protein
MYNSKLVVQNISKQFKNKKVISDFSFEFTPGCYAVTGENGVGKSTLLSLLCGALELDSGTILVNGSNLKTQSSQAKACLAYVPDQSIIYPFMKGKEFFDYVANYRKPTTEDETQKLCEKFQISTYYNETFNKMSLGTQKKFFITASAIGNPGILILDEPTNGLDKNAKHELVDYILRNKNNKIMVISTHDLELINQIQPQTIQLLRNH